jgi:hypothetical protein
MKPNKRTGDPDSLDKTENREPVENQVRDWSEEDVAIENRKPDLGEIEEDSSEL